MKTLPRKLLAARLGVWAALLALLALTAGSAFVHLGVWNSVINMAIAVAKAALVVLFFMHLKTATALLRIVAAAALFMLAVLFGLSHADYATRSSPPAAYQAPVPP